MTNQEAFDKMFALNPSIKRNSDKKSGYIEFTRQVKKTDLSAADIYTRYARYIRSIKTANLGRDDRYKTKSLSVEEWLEQEQYLQTWEDDEDRYLYG